MDMKTLLIALMLLVGTASPALPDEVGQVPLAQLRAQLAGEFAGRQPRGWGETVPGVATRLKSRDRVIALTLDACGGTSGSRFDATLMDYLERQRIPATLFVNGRWIDANRESFMRLASNPLFEIANHGLQHRPASVSGRSAYGIAGTASVAELVDEIEGNARKIFDLTGKRTRHYRSGTAYYDELAVQLARRLGHQVAGFSLLGDAGATYSPQQVAAALLRATAGDIVILHMNHPEGGTAAGVMEALPELQRRGFRFVRLSDCPLDPSGAP